MKSEIGESNCPGGPSSYYKSAPAGGLVALMVLDFGRVINLT
jgi:hypothetical protein